MEYLKRNEEGITAYWIRLYKNKQLYGLTFAECGQLMNEVTGENWSEAKWRRPIEHYLEITSYLEEENPTGLTNDALVEIELAKEELQKEKVKYSDQKREYRNRLRSLARLEHLEDFLKQEYEVYEPVKLETKMLKDKSDKEMIVMLSDWHIGMQIDNQFNKFNIEVAKERIGKLRERMMEKVEQDDIGTVHIAQLGDLVNGSIHISTRIANEEDIIQQIIITANLLQEFVKPLIDKGINVEYYNIIGNHGRVSPSKMETAGIDENFEKLLFTMMSTYYKDSDNFHAHDSKDGLITAKIKNLDFCFAHGDFDKGTGVIAKLPQLFGYVFDYVLTGHLHRESIMDYGKTTHITNSALCGSDDYAMQLRLSSKPSQKILVLDDTGVIENNTIYL